MNEDRQLKYIQTGIESAIATTKHILENSDDKTEREELLESMKETVKNYIKMEHEYKTGLKVLDKLKKCGAASDDNNNGLRSQYEMMVHGEMSLRDEEDYLNDMRYQRLESVILGYFRPEDPGQVSSQTTDQLTDPWSRKPILAGRAVRNRRCGHVYDRDTVHRHLDNMRDKKMLRCPVTGCDQFVKYSDLKQ